MANTTVVVSDDHGLFRQGLCALIDTEPSLSLVGNASTGRETIDLVAQERPHLLVTDLIMPGLNGIEVIRAVMSHSDSTKILVVTGYVTSRLVGEALEAGACGLLPKSTAFSELTRAIKTVMGGKTYLSPSVADIVVQRYVRACGNGHNGAKTITTREREVLQLISEGHTTKEIAWRLSVSIKTIGTHRTAILRKLNLGSVAELTKYAVREGITALEV